MDIDVLMILLLGILLLYLILFPKKESFGLKYNPATIIMSPSDIFTVNGESSFNKTTPSPVLISDKIISSVASAPSYYDELETTSSENNAISYQNGPGPVSSSIAYLTTLLSNTPSSSVRRDTSCVPMIIVIVRLFILTSYTFA